MAGWAFMGLKSECAPIYFNEKLSENTCLWGILASHLFWLIIQLYSLTELDMEKGYRGKDIGIE